MKYEFELINFGFYNLITLSLIYTFNIIFNYNLFVFYYPILVKITRIKNFCRYLYLLSLIIILIFRNDLRNKKLLKNFVLITLEIYFQNLILHNYHLGILYILKHKYLPRNITSIILYLKIYKLFIGTKNIIFKFFINNKVYYIFYLFYKFLFKNNFSHNDFKCIINLNKNLIFVLLLILNFKKNIIRKNILKGFKFKSFICPAA